MGRGGEVFSHEYLAATNIKVQLAVIEKSWFNIFLQIFRQLSESMLRLVAPLCRLSGEHMWC